MELRYVYIIFQLIAFLFAISIHESAHAWMASRCGDPTARMLGRITLNPLRHIDPVGTILLPAIALFTGFPMIGWAKPTPVDPRNFKNPVRDDILTSVAGPASNFLVVIVTVVLLGLLALTSPSAHYVVHGMARHMILDVNGITPLALILHQLMVINILLGIFNLIPVPPLERQPRSAPLPSGGRASSVRPDGNHRTDAAIVLRRASARGADVPGGRIF